MGALNECEDSASGDEENRSRQRLPLEIHGVTPRRPAPTTTQFKPLKPTAALLLRPRAFAAGGAVFHDVETVNQKETEKES